MATREEIDALLIGRLYGELGSADEARLQEHLDAHPDDRTALAGLTQARGLIKESRLLDVQQEPPQSLSALLMQEAARRAPKKPETEGWFARFTRSFIAHPAMAAAATLVLVVGVAGTMYMKKGSQFAKETTTSSAAQRDAQALGYATTAPSAAPGGAAGEAPSADLAVQESLQQAAAGSAAAAPSELTLDEGKREDRQSMDVRLAEPDPAATNSVPRKQVVAQGQTRGMEITTPTVEPKDLPEDQLASGSTAPAPDRTYATKPTTKKPAKAVDSAAFDDDSASPNAHSGVASNGPGAGAAIGGGLPPPKGDADGNAVADESEKTGSKDTKSGKPTTDATKSKVAATPAPVASAPTKPSPPPPPAVTATTVATPPTAKKESSSANERELQAAVSAAQQNKCDEADRYATSIANRDLDYYSAQVEDNRDLKHCKAVMKHAPAAAQNQRAKRAAVRATSESVK